MNLSFFGQITNTTPKKHYAVDQFLLQVRDGEFQDAIIQLRRERDKDQQARFKKNLPLVTISGTFEQRGLAYLKEHSGFIGMDIDEIADVERLKALLRLDPYVYAFFHSCRGHGLCVLFKIDGRRHADAFMGLQEYFWAKYEQPVDPSGKDVSRSRFVSYDPGLHINTDAQLFKQYPKQKRAKARGKDFAHSDKDVAYIMEQIDARGVDITGGYGQWLEIGFAIVGKFGEAGRELYHQISRHSALYDPAKTDKQYGHCLRHGSQRIGIATLFYHAKAAGVDVTHPETKKAALFMAQQKRGHADKQEAIEVAIAHGGVSRQVAEQVAGQVYEQGLKVGEDQEGSDMDQVEAFLLPKGFRINAVTRLVEYPDGRELDDKAINDLWRGCCKALGNDKFTPGKILQVLYSSFCPEFNPLIEYFESLPEARGTRHLDALVACLPTDTGMAAGDFAPHLVGKFIKKWFVGVIASMHGIHSPLMLVLMGKAQGTGKTWFFRHLLPEALRGYYAETKLTEGKDDWLLMCRKLLLMLDEYNGRTLKDEKAMKELLSRDTFNIREPYGRRSVEHKRLAVLCATSNDTEILNDPTGNRRFICVNVTGPIDWAAYNAIDKDMLMAEAYQLWKGGMAFEILGDEIAELAQINQPYNEVCLEGELLWHYFSSPDARPTDFKVQMTTSEIKAHIERISQQKLGLKRLGIELAKVLGPSKSIKESGMTRRVFTLVKLDN